MGIELTIAKEFANIGLTATEWSALADTINGHIRNRDFTVPFNRMIAELARCYDLVDEVMTPFEAMDSEALFIENFSSCHDRYKGSFLHLAGRPRKYSDDAYETYLVLHMMKECRTSYPLLRRTFDRLDQFVDKWVTNDAWLAMNIDTLLKMFNRFLLEVAEFQRKDAEDAFLLYDSAFTQFRVFMTLIRQLRAKLPSLEGMESP